MKKEAKYIVETKLQGLFTHKNVKQAIVVDKFYGVSKYQNKILEEAKTIVNRYHHKFFSGFASKIDLPFI